MAGDSNVSLKMQPGGNGFVSCLRASLFICCSCLPLKTRPKFPFTARVGMGMWTGVGDCRWDAEDYSAFQTSQSFFLF